MTRSRLTKQRRTSAVRLFGEALEDLREAVWNRANHRCENPSCGKYVALNADSVWYKMDLAHIKSRGAGGEDTMDNTRCLCHRCHMDEHTKGKSCL